VKTSLKSVDFHEVTGKNMLAPFHGQRCISYTASKMMTFGLTAIVFSELLRFRYSVIHYNIKHYNN